MPEAAMLPAPRRLQCAAMQARSDPTAALRKALGKFATGVTVVTTRAADGTPDGITVNSFSSVSLDPPLVLWCIGLGAASYDTFRLASRHLVNVLAADQAELARHFATRGAKRFDNVGWSPTDTSLPRLDGCIGWFEIGLRSRHEEGDHLILVGRIESFEVVPGKPLLFFDSRFAELAEPPPAARSPRG
jgi:flavin reductase (DIM6/NTAB) family NADH-FMN oxidoreductase RutF